MVSNHRANYVVDKDDSMSILTIIILYVRFLKLKIFGWPLGLNGDYGVLIKWMYL